ncbi:MAG: XRE family transcriptional regulator [Bacteroidales bacterium]|nr:XRE family transcriptional regulator [Bacteroidales bacterium]
MREKLPINLNILKWARTSYNLSLAEVAHKIGKKTEIIKEWEDGESSPTYIQLEKLAQNVYNRPVALFFFPDIPSDVDPKADFRTLPQEFVDELPSEILKQYRNAKVMQLNLSELLNNQKIKEETILDNFKLSKMSRFHSLVYDIRKYLDIDYEEQVGWRNSDEAFKGWRNSLEANGVFIFKEAFKNDNYSGFCIYDEKYPIIMINNSTPKTRQIFTLFHELAHLLLKSGGIDLYNKEIFNRGDNVYSEIEIKCNKFAGEFLLPTSWFNQEKQLVNEKHIIMLADKFCVSREVILRKYLNLNLIDNQIYNRFIEKWYKDFPSNKTIKGGDYYYTKKAYLGDQYVTLTFKKYYQGKISIERLAEFLTLSVKNVSNFEQKAFAISM